MTMKKKLMSGALAATLGISMVGLGTWAAFNDVETVDASIAAGTLKMDLAKVGGKPFTFKISDLKPGDSMTREIKFENAGSLAIKDVMMAIESVTFDDYVPQEGESGYDDADTWGRNSAIEYLNQFRVSVMTVGVEGDSVNIIPNDKDVRLGDFYLASGSLSGIQEKIENGASELDIKTALEKVWGSVNKKFIDVNSHRLNGASIAPNKWAGIPVDPSDYDVLKMTIVFVDDDAENEGMGTYAQNIYQGDSADITVSFEARQWGGQEVTDSDIGDGNKGKAVDGYIQTNEKSNSEGPEVQ